MAIIQITIKPVKKNEEIYLHNRIDEFVNKLNREFGMIVTEYSKPTFNES